MFRRVAIVTALASVILTLPACDNSLGTSRKPDDKGGAPPAVTYDSPQKVFDAAVAAAGKEDWTTFMACLTEDSRDGFTGAVMIGAVMMKGFAEIDKEKGKDAAKAIDEALKKHGLDEETLKKDMPKGPGAAGGREALKKLVAPVKDKPAFIADVMAAFKKLGAKEMDKNFGGELKDLKVDGEKATATLKRTQNGREKIEPIEFRKVGGGWKIELPAQMLDPAG